MTDATASEIVHFGEYLALLRREKWRAVAVATVIGAAAVTLAIVWPPTYRSTATILIEEAGIPSDLVASAVNAFASQRIQSIQQRIITTANLATIIDKHGLYREEREVAPLPQVADLMRSNISLSLVSTETGSKGLLGGRDKGRDSQAAIAFTLSFDSDTPRTTQQVANELASLFLSESQRDRDKRASETTSFLEAESQRLHTDVQGLELRLEAFRTENAGLLPEDRSVNTELLDRVEGELLSLSRQLHTLRERQGLLRGQLASTPQSLPIAVDGMALSPAAQLASLQVQRAQMSARYGAKHPDVLALDRQIVAFSGTVAGGGDIETLAARVQILQAELDAASQKYGSKHPDTLKLERDLAAARAQLMVVTPAPAPQQGVMNPDYLQIQVEVASVNGELEAAFSQQQALEEKRTTLEQRISRGPAVERDYIALKRDYDAAVAKYLDVRSKRAEAELTKNLETQQMGETLTLIEPPVEPIAPIKPNRRAIIAIGLLAAIAGGILAGILHDAADERVHGWRQLATISGQTPFAAVPFIRTSEDRRWARRALLLQSALVVLLLAAALYYVNSYVMPLSVLWTSVAEWSGLGADAGAVSVAN